MKPSLQVRLSQHLALTPQLQQSIRLLQLSTLELHQEVDQMLEENPFLEVDDDDAAPAFDAPPERAAAAEREDVGGDADTDPVTEISGQEFGTTEREDWENGTERDDFDGIAETPSARIGQGEDDDFEGRDGDRAELSLQEHLRRQLLGMRLGREDMAAVQVLIDSLDGDGYLGHSPSERAPTPMGSRFCSHSSAICSRSRRSSSASSSPSRSSIVARRSWISSSGSAR